MPKVATKTEARPVSPSVRKKITKQLKKDYSDQGKLLIRAKPGTVIVANCTATGSGTVIFSTAHRHSYIAVKEAAKSLDDTPKK